MKFILMLIVFLVGCANHPGLKEFKEIEKIPISNETERIAKFSSYTVDKQIDIFVFSQCCVEGGSESYKKYIAFDGKNKILKIAERLDKTDHPMLKQDLMGALDFIDEECRCIGDNSEILKILEENKMQVNQGFLIKTSSAIA